MNINQIKEERVDNFPDHCQVMVEPGLISPTIEIGAPLSLLLVPPDTIVKDEFMPLEYLGNMLNSEYTSPFQLSHADRQNTALSASPRRAPQSLDIPAVFVNEAPSIVPEVAPPVLRDVSVINNIKVEVDSDCEIISETVRIDNGWDCRIKSETANETVSIINDVRSDCGIVDSMCIVNKDVRDCEITSKTVEQTTLTSNDCSGSEIVSETTSILKSTLVQPSKTLVEEVIFDCDSDNTVNDSERTFGEPLENNKTNESEIKTKSKKKQKSDRLMKKKKKQVYPPKNAQILKCEHCAYYTKDKSNLKKHTLCRHTDASKIELLQCTRCSYTTRIKENLRKHQQMHNETMFQCNQCTFSTKYKQGLEKHKIAIHEEWKEKQYFGCAHCHAFFKSKRSLIMHLAIHSSSKQTAKVRLNCQHCAFTTLRQRSLLRHQKKHLPPKYLCEKCPYKTSNKILFGKHALMHERKVYHFDAHLNLSQLNNPKDYRVESFKIEACTILTD